MNGNPITRLLAGLAFFVVLIFSFFLGAVALMVILGLGLVLAMVTAVRIWWLTRHARKAMREQGASAESRARRNEIYIIEGEFRRDEEDKKQ